MVNTVRVEAGGLLLDPCNIGLPMEIVHGRGNIDTQPDAPTCQFTWLSEFAPASLGDELKITDTVDYAAGTWADPNLTWADVGALWSGHTQVDSPRFVGNIDQITAREVDGQVVSWDVEAIGGQARLGYQLLPKFMRPVEDDVSRVLAIRASGDLPVIYIHGTATVTVTAYTPDPSGTSPDPAALGELHTVAESSGGLLWQDPAGNMNYGTANHRTIDSPIPLDCEVIADGLQWGEGVDTVINQVSIEWGPEASRTTSTYAVTYGPSNSPWGERSEQLSSILQNQVDADELGLLIINRRAEPYWGTPAVVVWADDLAGMQAIAALDVSKPVAVPYSMVPSDTPAPVTSIGIVEGWVETWDTNGHRLQLAISDANRWGLHDV